MTDKQIKAILADFKSTELPHYERYQAYYEGQNPTILDKEINPDPDNRKAIAFARKAVNTITGYMFMPGKIVFEYEDEKNETIKWLNSEAGQLKINQIATNALVNGKGYCIVFQEDNTVKVAVAKTQSIKIKWDDNIEPEKEAAYYFTKKKAFGEDGKKKIIKRFWNYEATKYELYEATGDAGEYTRTDSGANKSKMVNVPEFIISPEKRNVFFHVIGLIDLMDELVSSNMANEMQTIAQAILAMYGKYLDDEIVDEDTGLTERQKFLNSNIKIIDGLQKANGEFIEWITKQVQWEGVFGIFDKIKNLIWELLEIPNLTDDTFNTQATGPAMAWKVFPFENKCAMIEAYFKQGLLELIDIMGAFPAGDKVDQEKLKITFKRNVPQDRKTRIEEAALLSTMIGKEYAIEYIGKDILPNMEEILEKAREDVEREMVNLLEGTMRPEPQAEEEE